MANTTIQFATYPRTEPPPTFVPAIIDVFKIHEERIATTALEKGLQSDGVLAVLHDDLIALGFQVESGKMKAQKIERPVFYGNNGLPTVKYEIDAYNPEWKCGLEIEAGRGWMGNAVYRDLVQAMVMVEVEYLVLAVSNTYKFKSSGKNVTSRDFFNAQNLADAIYGHSRFRLPYRLVLIGY